MHAQYEPPEKAQCDEYSHASTLSALEELRRVLATFGWEVRLHTGPPSYLRVMNGYLVVEFVFVAWCDDPHYTWNQTTCVHSLGDPAGAASRIVEELTAEQRRAVAGRG